MYKFIIFLVLVILLASGAILTSILIFGRSTQGVGERLVEINFSGNQETESLAPNKFAIVLTNRELSDLKAAELKVNFPKGFILDKVDQPCTEKLVSGCTWSLGKIKRSEARAINLEGRFLEPSKSISDPKSFSGVLNFQLEDFSSNFQKEFKSDVFVKPILAVDLKTDNTNVVVGQKKRWQINLRKLTGQDISHNIKVVLETPSNFVVTEVPLGDIIFTTEGRRATWLISNLNLADEYSPEKQIYFDGYLSQFSEISSVFKVRIEIEDTSGQFFVQNEISKSVTIQGASLNISLSTGDNQSTFRWGEEIPLKFSYQNAFSQLEDLNFSIEISNSRYIDWQKLTDLKWHWSSGQNQIDNSSWLVKSSGENRTIIWDKSQIIGLGKVAVGETGEILFNLKTVAEPQNINTQEIIMKIRAGGKYSENGELFKIESAPLILKIMI